MLLQLLRQYSWPGNIRELRNAVERGLALARGNMIMPTDLPASIQRAEQASAVQAEGKSATGTRTDTLDDAEREYLIRCSKRIRATYRNLHCRLECRARDCTSFSKSTAWTPGITDLSIPALLLKFIVNENIRDCHLPTELLQITSRRWQVSRVSATRSAHPASRQSVRRGRWRSWRPRKPSRREMPRPR